MEDGKDHGLAPFSESLLFVHVLGGIRPTLNFNRFIADHPE